MAAIIGLQPFIINTLKDPACGNKLYNKSFFKRINIDFFETFFTTYKDCRRNDRAIYNCIQFPVWICT